VREKRPLLRSTEGNRTTSPVDLEGAEDTKVHLAPEHALTAPSGYERLHLLRDVEFLGSQLDDVDGIGESLEMQFPVIEVPDAIDRAGEMNQVLTGQDLAGTGFAAQAGGKVQGPAAIPAAHGRCLSHFEADSHGKRKIGGRPSLL
jgi:hypothetical protein